MTRELRRRDDWREGCASRCRAFSDVPATMASEGGGDSQLRRRRRREPEEPEKTERSERELTVVVAVAQENEEEDEERWVGPLPVEATLAKKRKGSWRHRPRASWNRRAPDLELAGPPAAADAVWLRGVAPSEPRVVF